jgi:hypothetical protein
MLPLRTTRRQLWTLVGAASAALARRAAAALTRTNPRPPDLLPVDDQARALDLVRAAWLVLRGSGRSDAQVSQTLRHMINLLEAGRVDRPN